MVWKTVEPKPRVTIGNPPIRCDYKTKLLAFTDPNSRDTKFKGTRYEIPTGKQPGSMDAEKSIRRRGVENSGR